MNDFNAIFEFINQLHEAKAHAVGNIGENAINQFALEHLSNDYFIFADIVIQAGNGTTQIDQVIVSKYGIFVIEIKNYKGWIFGDVQNSQWTQVLTSGKYRFQNPLRQNYKHIKSLQTLLGFHNDIFKSLVAFFRAEFKTVLPKNIVNNGSDYLNFINNNQKILLSEQQVLETIEKIKKSCLTQEQHQAHITKIKQQYNHANENNAPQCPRCNNIMVLRKARNTGNAFWGCSHYPQCTAIINIKNDYEKMKEAFQEVENVFNFMSRIFPN